MRPMPILDTEYVTARLVEAGSALMGMPPNAPRMGVKVCDYGFVSEMCKEAVKAGEPIRVRAPSPSASAITRMDEAFGWLSLIPAHRFVLRRIVAARSLTSPVTGEPINAWSKLAGALGADYRAIQRWHGQGILIIAQALSASGYQPTHSGSN